MALVALQDLSRYSNIFFTAHFLRPVFSFSSWSSSLLLLLLFLLRFLRRRAGIFVYFRPGNTFQSFYFLFCFFLESAGIYPGSSSEGYLFLVSSLLFFFSSRSSSSPLLSHFWCQFGWPWLHHNPSTGTARILLACVSSPSCLPFPLILLRPSDSAFPSFAFHSGRYFCLLEVLDPFCKGFIFCLVSFLNMQAFYPVCIQKGTSSSSFPFSSSSRGDLLPPSFLTSSISADGSGGITMHSAGAARTLLAAYFLLPVFTFLLPSLLRFLVNLFFY